MKNDVPVMAVNFTEDPLRPLHDASTLYNPALLPRVRVDAAIPFESVALSLSDSPCYMASYMVSVMFQFTVFPLTPFP